MLGTREGRNGTLQAQEANVQATRSLQATRHFKITLK